METENKREECPPWCGKVMAGGIEPAKCPACQGPTEEEISSHVASARMFIGTGVEIPRDRSIVALADRLAERDRQIGELLDLLDRADDRDAWRVERNAILVNHGRTP